MKAFSDSVVLYVQIIVPDGKLGQQFIHRNILRISFEIVTLYFMQVLDVFKVNFIFENPALYRISKLFRSDSCQFAVVHRVSDVDPEQ